MADALITHRIFHQSILTLNGNYPMAENSGFENIYDTNTMQKLIFQVPME
jgi:hypothetical protein